MSAPYTAPTMAIRGSVVELTRSSAEILMTKSKPVPECGGYFGKL